MQPGNTSTDCAGKLVRTSTKEARQRSRNGAGREPPLPCHCVLCRLEAAILQRQRPTLQRARQRQAPGSARDGRGSVDRSSYSLPLAPQLNQLAQGQHTRSPTQSRRHYTITSSMSYGLVAGRWRSHSVEHPITTTPTPLSASGVSTGKPRFHASACFTV